MSLICTNIVIVLLSIFIVSIMVVVTELIFFVLNGFSEKHIMIILSLSFSLFCNYHYFTVNFIVLSPI